MTSAHSGYRCGWILALFLTLSVLLSACSDTSDTSPEIKVAIGNATTTLTPTLYCVDGEAHLADESTRTAALEAAPDTAVAISVPQQVADVGWTIQIWSVSDTDTGAVPLEQIGNVDAGTAREFDGFTTSDVVPNRYFVIIALPEDPDCNAQGSAGIWTLLVSRVG
ncbi:MAG: DUF2771 family protein [Cumulibacter sp.]